MDDGGCSGGITINRVPVCPTGPHQKCAVVAKISIKGWVINPDEQGLLDCPGDALGIPLHCGGIEKLSSFME